MIRVIEESPEKLNVELGMTISMEQILNCLKTVFDVIKANNSNNIASTDTRKMDTVLKYLSEINEQYISD